MERIVRLYHQIVGCVSVYVNRWEERPLVLLLIHSLAAAATSALASAVFTGRKLL